MLSALAMLQPLAAKIAFDLWHYELTDIRTVFNLLCRNVQIEKIYFFIAYFVASVKFKNMSL